jgi:hypothetical protein
MEAVTNAGHLIHHLNLTKVSNITVNAQIELLNHRSQVLFSAAVPGD